MTATLKASSAVARGSRRCAGRLLIRRSSRSGVDTGDTDPRADPALIGRGYGMMMVDPGDIADDHTVALKPYIKTHFRRDPKDKAA
jgi:hypothetical protein